MTQLFSDNFPDISTDEELQKLKSVYPSYDGYYIASGAIPHRRELFNKLWPPFEPYADSHFLGQVKSQFHQRTWEMYVGNVLIQYGYTFESKDTGPDFQLSIGDKKIWIEAVAATSGEGDNRVPEMIPDGQVRDVPEEEMLLRFASSLKTKKDKYTKYTPSIVSPADCCLIAINTGETNNLDPGIPLIHKCLFALGYLTYPLSSLRGGSGKPYWSTRESLVNKNGTPISMRFFGKNNTQISGVIYSNKTVLNHPAKLGDDCIVVHNPFATNKLSLDDFKSFDQWVVDGDNIRRINKS